MSKKDVMEAVAAKADKTVDNQTILNAEAAGSIMPEVVEWANEKRKTTTKASVVIKPQSRQTIVFKIRGNSPLVIHRFGKKANTQLEDSMTKSSQKKKGGNRPEKDYPAEYEAAKHVSFEGWLGVSALSVKHAIIDACAVAGFKMTIGKRALFVEQDGFDCEDASPLIRITKGEPRMHKCHVRVKTGGADIRARPMWEPGWEAMIRVTYDKNMFEVADVASLVNQAGLNGIHEGRPSSKMSVGCGWGTFEIAND